MSVSDVIIIGGGISGLVAGIKFSAAGRSVILLERATQTAEGPGETLHPGIGTIFNILGVAQQIETAATNRHAGILVDNGRGPEFIPYGENWYGYQIRRRTLTKILEQRLYDLGGRIYYGCKPETLFQSSKKNFVDSNISQHSAHWLIDATGPSGWLNRRFGSKMIQASKPLWLRYGYTQIRAQQGELPYFRYRGETWSWQAPLGNGELAWVECSPNRFDAKSGQFKGADGTWVCSDSPAGHRYFRVGDAAFRLDPSTGQGVLRATMTSIMAVHLAISVDDGALQEQQAVEAYNRWTKYWFKMDGEQTLENRLFSMEGGRTNDETYAYSRSYMAN